MQTSTERVRRWRAANADRLRYHRDRENTQRRDKRAKARIRREAIATVAAELRSIV